MRVIFSEYAKFELEDDMRFYEFQFEGVGQKFKEEVRKAINRISVYPKA